MNNKKQRYFILLFICLVASLLNSSCSSNNVAPVSTRSGNHDKQAEKVVAKARATPSKVVDKKKISSYCREWRYTFFYFMEL